MNGKARDAARSCKAIVVPAQEAPSRPAKTLFLMTSWGANSFDIKATDSRQSWAMNDITAHQGHIYFSPVEWMKHAKEALFDLSPPRTFTYGIEEDDLPDGPGIELSWKASYNGVEYICQIPLLLLPDSSATVESMLVHLCHSYRVMQEAVTHVDKQNADLVAELKKVQSQALEQIESSRQREADMYVKFTLLLNSKKEHAKQLADRLAAAEGRSRHGSEDDEQAGPSGLAGPSVLSLPAVPGQQAGPSSLAQAAALPAAGVTTIFDNSFEDEDDDEEGGETTDEGDDLLANIE